MNQTTDTPPVATLRDVLADALRQAPMHPHHLSQAALEETARRTQDALRVLRESLDALPDVVTTVDDTILFDGIPFGHVTPHVATTLLGTLRLSRVSSPKQVLDYRLHQLGDVLARIDLMDLAPSQVEYLVRLGQSLEVWRERQALNAVLTKDALDATVNMSNADVFCQLLDAEPLSVSRTLSHILHHLRELSLVQQPTRYTGASLVDLYEDAPGRFVCDGGVVYYTFENGDALHLANVSHGGLNHPFIFDSPLHDDAYRTDDVTFSGDIDSRTSYAIYQWCGHVDKESRNPRHADRLTHAWVAHLNHVLPKGADALASGTDAPETPGVTLFNAYTGEPTTSVKTTRGTATRRLLSRPVASATRQGAQYHTWRALKRTVYGALDATGVLLQDDPIELYAMTRAHFVRIGHFITVCGTPVSRIDFVNSSINPLFPTPDGMEKPKITDMEDATLCDAVFRMFRDTYQEYRRTYDALRRANARGEAYEAASTLRVNAAYTAHVRLKRLSRHLPEPRAFIHPSEL